MMASEIVQDHHDQAPAHLYRAPIAFSHTRRNIGDEPFHGTAIHEPPFPDANDPREASGITL